MKTIISLTSIFLMLLVLTFTLGASAAQGPSDTTGKTWILKTHTEQTLVSAFHVNAHQPWADDIEKATKGRVKIQFYPSQTLMKSADAWSGVKSGLCDVAWIFTGYFPGQFDLLDSVALPFIAPSAEVASKTAWSLYQEFPQIQAQSADAKVLSVWTSDPYILITTKKQIKTLEDFKGLKMRVTGGPPTDMMKLLGAAPMAVPMPDIYTSLQRGVIDGAAVPSDAVTAFKLCEFAKYYTIVPTVCVWFMYVMNKNVWQEMPPDIQQAIMSVSGEKQAIRGGRDGFDKTAKVMEENVKKLGFEMVKYTPPANEINRWIDAAGRPVWKAWADKMEAKSLPGRKVLEETQRLIKQYK